MIIYPRRKAIFHSQTPCKMIEPPTRSIKRAIGFSVFLFIVTVWLWAPVIHNKSLVGANIVFLLFGLTTLQPFLLYRVLASLRVLSARTDRLDDFFYGDRRGGLALMVLGILWTLFALYMEAMITIASMFRSTSILDTLRSVVGDFVADFLWMISPFVFGGLMVWSGITATKSLWRVTAPRPRMEAVPLGPDEEVGDDDWDGWKDNTG